VAQPERGDSEPGVAHKVEEEGEEPPVPFDALAMAETPGWNREMRYEGKYEETLFCGSRYAYNLGVSAPLRVSFRRQGSVTASSAPGNGFKSIEDVV